MPIWPCAGTAWWMRQRKSCFASSAEGTLNEVTRQPCGFSPDITCRTVPSLPLASMPCKTINKARRLSAYSRYCKSSMREMFFSKWACALSPFSKPAVSSGSNSPSRNRVCDFTINCLPSFISSTSFATSSPLHLADDFLDDVLDGEDANVLAFGVDNDADGTATGTQDGEDAVDTFRGEHELRLLHELPGGFAVATGTVKKDFVDVDDADNSVALPDGEAGEAGALGDREELCHRRIANDRDGSRERQHDAVHRLVGKIENSIDHLAFLRAKRAARLPFLGEVFQFLAGDKETFRRLGATADANDRAHHEPEQGHKRGKQPRRRVQRVGNGHAETVRIMAKERFWDNFTDHQQERRGDDRCGEVEPEVIDVKKARREHRRVDTDQHVGEVGSKQCSAQQAFGVFDEPVQDDRAAALALDLVPQADTVQGNQPCFRARKERRAQDAHDNNHEIVENAHVSVPRPPTRLRRRDSSVLCGRWRERSRNAPARPPSARPRVARSPSPRWSRRQALAAPVRTAR